MNILDTIIEKKRLEVERRKITMPFQKLEQSVFFKGNSLSFRDFLLRDDKTGIIAEFKRRSPSKGIINNTSSVEEVTNIYAACGASAISILTDEEFFGGNLSDLEVATKTGVPLLRKDFIIDEYQVVESKSFGAHVILLIAACLTKGEVKNLSKIAKDIGLNVLLEIHNEEELDHIFDDVDVVGVNNRDLKTFVVSLEQSLLLGGMIPSGKVKISESGIDSVSTIQLLRQHGFKGFLMGEKFMKEKDPGMAFRDFVMQLRS